MKEADIFLIGADAINKNFLVHKIVRKDEIFEKLADEIENIFMEKEEVK
jgi:hypothetical protein